MLGSTSGSTSTLKKTIEDAAAEMGQPISDFPISHLVHAARKILHEQQVTRLSERNRQVFAACWTTRYGPTSVVEFVVATIATFGTAWLRAAKQWHESGFKFGWEGVLT